MSEPGDSDPELLLGPMLRYAGTESATFWLETSASCEVEILGHRTSTFAVEGHYYALLLVEDLTPGSVTPYEVRLDGRLAWPPEDGRPQPVVRTRNHERRARLAFGSCRVGDPQPTNLGAAWPKDVRAIGIDALWTYAKQLQRGDVEWPDAVLLLGDQVYADEVSPQTLAFIREKRGTDEPPGRADRRLRGVHAALPGILVGAGHPMAVLHRADGHDLRRPRRARRLEHLVALGRGDASNELVGEPDHRRVHGVLALPASRQPLPARARGGHDATRR